MNASFTVTHDRDWTWIHFPGKPAESILASLRTFAKFSRRRVAWYITSHLEESEVAAKLGTPEPEQNTPAAELVLDAVTVDVTPSAPQLTAGKIPAVKFELYRAEGLIEECGPAAQVTTWAAADNILRNWARTAPQPGQGYDKCDFKVTYADGETYDGRYDLKFHDQTFPELLAYHIRGYQSFYAGTNKPDWMSEENYRKNITEDDIRVASDFLARYEVGDPNGAPAVLDFVPTRAPEPEPQPSREETEAAAKREADRLEAEGRKLWPSLIGDCPAVIIAEQEHDESDHYTDYYGSRTVATVILAASKHTRDLFPEMRKAAEKIAETRHLGVGKGKFTPYVAIAADFRSNGSCYYKGSRSHWHRELDKDENGDSLVFLTREAAQAYIDEKGAPEPINFDGTTVSFEWQIDEDEIEHREKYSMGKGYYLGYWYESGWHVCKHVFYKDGPRREDYINLARRHDHLKAGK